MVIPRTYKDDPYDLFRSVIISLAYETQTLNGRGGYKNVFIDVPRFSRAFKRFVDSQHLPPTRTEKQDFLRHAKALLRNMDRKLVSRVSICATDLDKEMESAKNLLAEHGKIILCVFLIFLFRNCACCAPIF